ncbi:MAG: NAD(+)/NADH kinase [Coriobacteriales bacterium]|nr:NAD(+)/NADH kinase [Coriobacteriales bacterium]
MRVLLVSNATKELVSEACLLTSSWLNEQGITFDHISSERLLINEQFLAECASNVKCYDMVISFGGDGTILRVARMIGSSGVPLLAFNFGGMGFLTSAQPEAVLPALTAAMAGETHIEERAFAEIAVTYDDGTDEHYLALNEVAISRGNFGRIVSLDLFINNSFVEKARGDGVLVATATGSTAYALSAGGPLISPDYAGLVVVPISPHSLKSWSIVTGPADIVVLKPSLDNAQRIVLFLDGEVLWSNEALAQGDLDSDIREVVSVAVSSSQTKLQLVRLNTHDFYEQVALTFFGSAYDR